MHNPSSSLSNLSTEFKKLALLSLPLIASGFVEFSSGFMGTLMLGHVSPEALAAGSLMNSVFTALTIFPWGLLGAVSVLVSQYHGAKQDQKIVQVVKDAFLVVLVLAPLAMLVLWESPWILRLFNQSPEVIAAATPGLHAYAWAMLPDFMTLVLLQYVLGMGYGRLNLIFSLFWTPCNILLVAAFIFGWWHFPKLGVAGVGWGFTVTSWIVLSVILTYLGISPRYRDHRIYLQKILGDKSKKISYFKRILVTGAPIGGTYMVDLVYFLFYALMMGTFGVVFLAAHQIVMQYFWLASVICFAIGQAMTVQIGNSYGANTFQRILPITYLGMGFMSCIMFGVASIFWVFPDLLIKLDLAHPPSVELLHIARNFFLMAGVVQILQAGWISALATLRGLGDTQALMVLSIIAEFIVGLPLAYFMAFHSFLHGNGIWVALIIDSVVFITLGIWRIRFKMRFLLVNSPRDVIL